MHTARIAAVHDGASIPLFGASSPGPASPGAMPVETHCLEPGDWHTHRLDTQMLTMFMRSSAVLHCEADAAVRRIPVAAHSLAFSLRGTPESVRWLAPVQFISVSLGDPVMRAAAEETGNGHFELLPNPGVRDERLSALFQALYLEQASGFASGRLFVDAMEQAIAATLVSRYNAFAPATLRPVNSLPAYCARRVEDYIQAHLDQPLSLHELALRAGFSRAHFSRLFHATFGLPAHQYVLRARVERAKSLLHRQAPSLLEVALACGFQTSQHFSRTFQRYTGLAPSAFRRACQ